MCLVIRESCCKPNNAVLNRSMGFQSVGMVLVSWCWRIVQQLLEVLLRGGTDATSEDWRCDLCVDVVEWVHDALYPRFVDLPSQVSICSVRCSAQALFDV